MELFTDGSSFMDQGKWYVGYAVVTLKKIAEAKALPPGSSAQKAEIIALTRALLLTEDRRGNIFTDSHYALSMVHAHGTIWKERGCLTLNNKDIKHASEILSLLETVHKPSQVAIIHRPGHQKGETRIMKGNQLADQAAKKAAKEGNCQAMKGSLLAQVSLSKYQIVFSETDKERAKEWGFTLDHTSPGWKCSAQRIILIPEALLYTVLQHIHNSTHYGSDATLQWIQKYIMGPNLQRTIQQVTQNCMICAENNPKTALRTPQMGTQHRGNCPAEDWQTDFIQMPRATGNFRYLLVFWTLFQDGWRHILPEQKKSPKW